MDFKKRRSVEKVGWLWLIPILEVSNVLKYLSESYTGDGVRKWENSNINKRGWPVGNGGLWFKEIKDDKSLEKRQIFFFPVKQDRIGLRTCKD